MKIRKNPITLLEIMIVIFIIGLIGSVVGYSMKGSLDEGRAFKCEQGSKQVYDLLMLQVAEGKPLNEVLANPKECLKRSGFVTNPEKLMKDGWSKDFVLKKIGKDDFIVYSKNWENYLEQKKDFDKEKMHAEFPWAFHYQDEDVTN